MGTLSLRNLTNCGFAASYIAKYKLNGCPVILPKHYEKTRTH
jgi:hypothetical protein